MKQVKIMLYSKRKIKRNFFILSGSLIGIYSLMSLYFFSHFFFHTEINGINVSLRAYRDLPGIISDYIKKYELIIIERNGVTELITSRDIDMKYHKSHSLTRVNRTQIPFTWISSLFKDRKYYIEDLYEYNNSLLADRINRLTCMNGKVEEPHNVDYKYMDGSYQIVPEIYGDKIDKERFEKVIKKYIAEGKRTLDLDSLSCYVNPKYSTGSEKTLKTLDRLNKYVSTQITYQFGNVTELLDGATIHQWLSVDDELEVMINDEEVAAYVRELSKKYDTVGIIRDFQSSTGKKVELQGGLYGWKIDRAAEVKALVNHIQHGDVLQKEPEYLQKAYSREGNEIGSTYIEINISKQRLWFYRDGKMIAQGAVVTGNPSRGNATVLGVYMVNYKQKNAILSGPGYEAKVTYWMPFFGNMGLHDASWRFRFGGEIYLRNGTHGCVNAPLYLARIVFENVEEGTPVIIYKE